MAATELFTERGYEVPLEEIAARAGLGRGTLYRNFRDRADLAVAVLEKRLDEIAAFVDEHRDDPGAFFPFLKDLAFVAFVHTPLLEGLEADQSGKGPASALRSRAEQIFAIPLDLAQRARLVREDLTAGDLLLAANMLASGHGPRVDDRGAVIDAAMKLLTEGLRPRE